MKGINTARPQELNDGQSLWVQDVFYTLQGEGLFSGQPAIFVRLAGCNLRCCFCDTDFESSFWVPALYELLDKIAELRPKFCNLIVLTGGEPFRQNIAPFTRHLLDLGLTVLIETNGTLWVDLPFSDRLFIVCSPKTPALHPQIIPLINAYKYVLACEELSPQDGLPVCSTQDSEMRANIARPAAGSEVFVMPMDTGESAPNKLNVAAAVCSALTFGYRLTLQKHKLIGIP